MRRRDPGMRPCAGRLALCVVLSAAAGCASPPADGGRAAPGGGGSSSGDHPSEPLPAPRPTSLASEELPDPEMFSSGSSSFWRALDDEAVRRYATANERRIIASRMKDADAAAAAAREYDRYFSLHRRYHQRYIEAETVERMTALGVKIGASLRP